MLVIGIRDKELRPEERDWIRTPAVSGVILFTRNFASRTQVADLVASIRELRPDPFLLSVDQEGGPVQRFREGFTALPALARIGELYDSDPRQALAIAEEHAWLMATEMRALDIDLSFAPVVDLKRGNRAIGERAFHTEPAAVSALGLAYLRGMRLAGMAATIKHFPGHGSVLEDTHFDNAADLRSLDELRRSDLIPFGDAIAAGAEAVMMAHVAYPNVDAHPAGYSRVWIEDILRAEYGFKGIVFSDDISMFAALGRAAIARRVHVVEFEIGGNRQRELRAEDQAAVHDRQEHGRLAVQACDDRATHRRDRIVELPAIEQQVGVLHRRIERWPVHAAFPTPPSAAMLAMKRSRCGLSSSASHDWATPP